MTDPATAPAPARKRRINLGFDKYSGLYVWAVLVIIFSLWIPNLFLQWDNFTTILSFQAISTVVALGLIVPVAAGAFDLTIAGAMTVSAAANSQRATSLMLLVSGSASAIGPVA